MKRSTNSTNAAPALPAQEAPEAEGLQGVWVLAEVREKNGVFVPAERVMDYTTLFISAGRRFTLRSAHPATGEITEESTGTFEAAGGTLLFDSNDGGEPEKAAYTLENGVLTLLFMENGALEMGMIFRRGSTNSANAHE